MFYVNSTAQHKQGFSWMLLVYKPMRLSLAKWLSKIKRIEAL